MRVALGNKRGSNKMNIIIHTECGITNRFGQVSIFAIFDPTTMGYYGIDHEKF